MSFNINNFRSELVGGGARSVLFEIIIPGLQKFTMMGKATTLPGRTITPIEVPYFGELYKVPGDVVYTDWTTTIINDEDFLCRNYIESWMNEISTHIGNVRTMAPAELQQDLEVIQYSKMGHPIKSYKLIHAWPTELAEIDLGWENANQVEEFIITWSYTLWIANTVENGGRSSMAGEAGVRYGGGMSII